MRLAKVRLMEIATSSPSTSMSATESDSKRHEADGVEWTEKAKYERSLAR